jgi:hypothetical protein
MCLEYIETDAHERKCVRHAIKQALAAQPAVPDALNPKDENPAYAAGWNDCRAAMLEMMK